MAEFQEVMQQRKRMCKNIIICAECKLSGINNGKHPRTDCGTFVLSYPEEAEKIIMDWAAAHPEPQYPTWKEWQTGTFPKHDTNAQICPKCFLEVHGCPEFKGCDDCYNERIPAEIAEKLGIRLKEVK